MCSVSSFITNALNLKRIINAGFSSALLFSCIFPPRFPSSDILSLRFQYQLEHKRDLYCDETHFSLTDEAGYIAELTTAVANVNDSSSQNFNLRL
jgi:hypothetical protein